MPVTTKTTTFSTGIAGDSVRVVSRHCVSTICPKDSAIKIAALIIGLAIAGVLGFAATKPDAFQVERTLRIKAPASSVFPLVNDFRAWDGWSPWAYKDPDMSNTLTGATSGLGAVYAWSGNRDVGRGRMEIIDTSPPSMVRIRLDFIEPTATTNMVEFSLEPDDDYTEVTWLMEGPMPYVAKLFSVFVPVDDRVGADFEAGLASLKALAER